MPLNVERFASCLKPYASQEEIQRLVESCGQTPTSPEKKARFTKCLMDNFEKQFPEDIRFKVMEDCGRRCIGQTTIEKARRIKKNSKNLEDLVDGLNRQHIGGGKMKLEGNRIHAFYERCYCGTVNKTKEKFSSTYCNCGKGWFLELFKEILGKPVRVDLVQSIIQGAQDCKFVIYV